VSTPWSRVYQPRHRNLGGSSSFSIALSSCPPPPIVTEKSWTTPSRPFRKTRPPTTYLLLPLELVRTGPLTKRCQPDASKTLRYFSREKDRLPPLSAERSRLLEAYIKMHSAMAKVTADMQRAEEQRRADEAKRLERVRSSCQDDTPEKKG